MNLRNGNRNASRTAAQYDGWYEGRDTLEECEAKMHTLNKWIRKLHRWLSLPFVLAFAVVVVSSIPQGEAFQLAGWLTVVAIGSLLGLLLTGLYMFVQHYGGRWQRTRRSSR